MWPDIFPFRAGSICPLTVFIFLTGHALADIKPRPGHSTAEAVQLPSNPTLNSEESCELTGLVRDLRDSRTKFDPSYKWIGLGKREDGPRAKFGNSYKWIGLGKRAQKFSNSYKYIGLGKRDAEFVPAKYRPGYKYIGLGKRMAPYWSSQLLQNFKDVFGENEKQGISRGRFMRPVYSAVTKKTTPEDIEAGTIFSEEELPIPNPNPSFNSNPESPHIVTSDGRPNARGGAFEPVYVGRYVGLGR